MMRLNMKRLVVLLFPAASALHAAQDSVLQGYIDAALREHPALGAARAEVRAAEQRVRVSGALPDPELSVGIAVPPMERYMGDQVTTVSLMQMLPAFGTRAAARDEARAMTAMRAEAARETRDRVAYEVRAAWYDLYARAADVGAAEEAVEILRAVERITLERYGAGAPDGASGRGSAVRSGGTMESDGASASGGGMGTMPGMGGAGTTGRASGGSSAMSGTAGMDDMGASGGGMEGLLQLRLELLEAEEERERARADASLAAHRLNRLVGNAPGDSVTPPDSLEVLRVPRAERPGDVAENHPVLRMLAAEERALAAMERMNKRMGLPMVGIGVQYEYLRAREDGMEPMPGGHMWMPMVSVSVPLWRGKITGATREAALRRDAVAATREDAEQALRFELAETLRDLDDARRRAERFAAREELTRAVLRVQLARQASGEGELERALRTRLRLLDDARGLARALADQHIAAARLERLTGGMP